MSNKHRFAKLSKHRSTPTASISFHSNKTDDDDEHQLEFSYKKGSENLVDDDVVSMATSMANSGQEPELPQKEMLPTTQREVQGCLTKSVSEEDFQTAHLFTFEKPASNNSLDTDPVRDYLSKIRRQPCSLDSESSLSSKSEEGWPLLRGIKGKITKTLEDHISKDSRLKASSVEKRKTLPKQYEDDSSDEINIVDTPTDDSDLTSNLSPAVEASEFMTEESMFDNFVTNKNGDAKCEIMSSKSYSPLNGTLSKKSVRSKSEVSMSLSSLMINRYPSYESESGENVEKVETPKSIIVENTLHSTANSYFDEENGFFFKLVFKIQKYCYYIMPSCNNVIFHLLIIIFASVAHLVSSWLSGFILGTVLSCSVSWWFLKPREPKTAFMLPNYEDMPPLTIPVTETEDEPIIHKGWMNELMSEYNPDTYHVNCTQSVYIRLDGSYLRVSYPKSNIPKRAMYNEPRHELQFIDQRHHDITGASVELLPNGLARKRLWSKKYPICLVIPSVKNADSLQSSRDNSPEENVTVSKISNTKDSPIKKFLPLRNKSDDVVMFLFARTNREKDIWFDRFRMASKVKMLKTHSPSSSLNIATIENHLERTISVDLASLQLCSSTSNSPEEEEDEIDAFVHVKLTKELKFEKYMSHLLSPLFFDQSYSFLRNISKKGRRGLSNQLKSSSISPNLMWLNVLIGRIFFDFLTEDVWAKTISEKIQRKLNKIKLPNFLEGLTIKDINLGAAFPKLHRASDPMIDQKGLWVDLDLSYNGSFEMTLETKLNLLRLSKNDSADFTLSSMVKENESSESFVRSHIYNSEEEDSAESSSEDEIPLPEVSEGPSAEEGSPMASSSTGKKIIRLMDRLAQSSYFQNATKYKYIKRAMEEVSNTPIVLTVEIHWLTGTLALNVPPMPTDRLWYGFRKNPNLSIVARPKLGQHVVTITHITDWIEKKLVSEFQKILVMPNMDDLIIPIMLPAQNS